MLRRFLQQLFLCSIRPSEVSSYVWIFNFGLFRARKWQNVPQMAYRPGPEMALLFLFGSSCKEKNCLEARGRARGMSCRCRCSRMWLVGLQTGWRRSVSFVDAESEPCGHASQAWVASSDVSVRHLFRLASVAGMGVQ